jgi:hypothetical protein
MKLPAFKTLKNIIAVIKGIRAFTEVFLDKDTGNKEKIRE